MLHNERRSVPSLPPAFISLLAVPASPQCLRGALVAVTARPASTGLSVITYILPPCPTILLLQA